MPNKLIKNDLPTSASVNDDVIENQESTLVK